MAGNANEDRTQHNGLQGGVRTRDTPRPLMRVAAFNKRGVNVLCPRLTCLPSDAQLFLSLVVS